MSDGATHRAAPTSGTAAEPAHEVVARLRAAGCVFAEDEALLLERAAWSAAELAELVGRRVSGLPLEHVLGEVRFSGLRLAVTSGVFVPRRRSHLVVTVAASAVRAMPRPGGAHPVVVDLCCGSGALGVAIHEALGTAELHGVDVDPGAVRCARRNVGARGTVHVGDLYEPLPPTLRGRVDVIVANPPYVPTGEIALLPTEARDHEPRLALDGGPDGLDIARRIVAAAPDWLAPSGCLVIETSAQQAPDLRRIAERRGLLARIVTSDDLGATVLAAALSAGGGADRQR